MKMGEAADSSDSFFTNHWNGWKGFWCDRFAFLDHYSKFAIRQSPLPSWSDSAVHEFMSSDAIHGPTLRSAREAVKIAVTGSAIGAVSTAALSWKYSRSPHGALLALGAGAVFGWTFGQEAANHWLQLYRLDTLTAETKFLEWWEKKAESRS